MYPLLQPPTAAQGAALPDARQGTPWDQCCAWNWQQLRFNTPSISHNACSEEASRESDYHHIPCASAQLTVSVSFFSIDCRAIPAPRAHRYHRVSLRLYRR